MAQKVTVALVDDLDGSPAAETVAFTLDGVAYEIDLNEENAAAFRKTPTGWVVPPTPYFVVTLREPVSFIA